MKFSFKKILVLSLFLLSNVVLYANVKLPAIISDEMVLQQGVEFPIWGWADPGEKVQVEIAGQKRNTVADPKGNWQVKFDRLNAGGGPLEMTISGRNTIKLTKILVGGVWVCSGQSNMEWPVSLTKNAEHELLRSIHVKIRVFQLKHAVTEKPAANCVGSWSFSEPTSASGFSAVGYFFGRELHEKLNVPIGLIDSSWGGSAAEAWTRSDILEADPDYNDILEMYNAGLAKYKTFDNMIQAWDQWFEKQIQRSKDIVKANAEGKPRPEKPVQPTCPAQNYMPGGLYNGMIAPLVPYAIKGVIWYQGESNAFEVKNGSDGIYRANQYSKLFPAMIESWRQDWGLGKFPFYYVQIAPFGRVYKPNAAALLREAQLMTLDKVENTGMVVTMDIGNVNDIHPRNKQDVGKRLALWALSETYGQENIVFSGPLYISMKTEGNGIRLSFEYVGGGLSSKDGPLTHFTIAGKDKKFIEAKAVIEGDTIVVSSDKVPTPVAVRYAWSNAAVGNLFNKDGLPASPFRTDNWTDPALNTE